MPALDRLVLDTNNIVSFILNNDLLFVAELSLLHNIQLYTCREQIKELGDTLRYEKISKLLTRPPEEYVGYWAKYSLLVKIDQRFDRVPDLKDNYLFDLAYTVKSYYLVSGDREVLNMKQVNKIRVISVSELRRMLRDKK